MIIEFSFGNFRSFKDVQTLSFIATPITSKNKELDVNNVFRINEKESLLKTLAVYGANGSGKSNVVKAIEEMRSFVLHSFKKDDAGFKALPYLLNTEGHKKPIFFQIVFLLNSSRYRYGFELMKGEVITEWLFGPAKKKEVAYFTRERDDISVSRYFPEGKGVEKGKTKSTTLFLNVVEAFNGELSKKIRRYLTVEIGTISGEEEHGFEGISNALMDNPLAQKDIIKWLGGADFGIKSLVKREIPINIIGDKIPDSVKSMLKNEKMQRLLSERIIYDEKGKNVGSRFFDFESEESDGTKMFYNYSGVLIGALGMGYKLIIDEFNARLHPLLTKKIIELFQNPKSNPLNAQLVFVTHDTNLLNNELLRRDQIYFTEKNTKGESSLYSLIELKGVRQDASFEKDYIKGLYGAIPYLGNFDSFIDN